MRGFAAARCELGIFFLLCCADGSANRDADRDADGDVAHGNSERGANACTNCNSCTYTIIHSDQLRLIVVHIGESVYHLVAGSLRRLAAVAANPDTMGSHYGSTLANVAAITAYPSVVA